MWTALTTEDDGTDSSARDEDVGDVGLVGVIGMMVDDMFPMCWLLGFLALGTKRQEVYERGFCWDLLVF